MSRRISGANKVGNCAGHTKRHKQVAGHSVLPAVSSDFAPMYTGD